MTPTSPTGRALVALRLTDERAFVARVRKAFLNEQGPGDRRARVAATLGIGRRTLFRWLARYPEIERST